ncbi:MAG: acyltransferase [Bacteroidetes bacterium]|nr:acyltransferase [Bacteroidota bacterium]
MTNYVYRIISIIYYFFNSRKFKHLDFKTIIRPSVRIEGKEFITISRGVVVQRHGWLLAMKNDEYDPELVIGSGCAIGDFAHITCVRKVVLEDYVLLANRVYISDNQHGFSDIRKPIMHQPVSFTGEVVLGKGCWIGENVCVMASVGKNSIVAANAVVTTPIPDYCIAGGVPAKVLKRYNAVTETWERVFN